MPDTLVNDPVNQTGLIQRASAWADMSDDFVTPLQWVQCANFWYKKLSVDVSRLGYPLNETDVPITFNGAQNYTVPEPLALMATYFVRSDGTFRKLKRLNPVEGRFSGTNQYQGDPKQYHVKRAGNSIVFDFFPVPSTGTGVAMVIPHPPTLNLGSSVTFPLGWEEYIVLNMAKFALSKEETTNPMLNSALAEVKDYIQEAATSYLQTDGARIRDVNKEELFYHYDPATWLWL